MLFLVADSLPPAGTIQLVEGNKLSTVFFIQYSYSEVTDYLQASPNILKAWVHGVHRGGHLLASVCTFLETDQLNGSIARDQYCYLLKTDCHK